MSVIVLPLRLIPVPVQCVVLTTVFDLYLRAHPDFRSHLEGLAGRCCRIRVRDSGAVLYLLITEQGIKARPEHRGEVDLQVEATVSGYARLCFGGEDVDDLVFKQVIKLSGDSEIMLRFKRLLAAAELDWERELRRAFGEFFGDKVARFAKGLIAAEQKAAAGSRRMVNGCLRRIGAPNEERLQRWQAEVETLSRRLPPLKGRVTRLEHRLEALDRREGS